MNYQHAFHAGNFADVHKHVVLTRVLEQLRAKPGAFRVIDTHAGAARYDLAGPEAKRSPEWRDGIQRLRDTPQQAEAKALLEPYLNIVAGFNSGNDFRFYPGSPLIAKALLRPNDRLIACEVEPHAARSLKKALHGDHRAKVLAIDGWMALNANVPPKERRGLVLTDPAFEEADDFSRLSEGLAAAYRKWPTGIYLLWYPIKDRGASDALARRLRRLSVPKMMRCEITLGPARADAGLLGSGLIVVNPPYKLDRELEILLPALARSFSPAAWHRLDWLAQEKGPARVPERARD
jgi:23S rRNA (adenine2030-N6)-methyltransferase